MTTESANEFIRVRDAAYRGENPSMTQLQMLACDTTLPEEHLAALAELERVDEARPYWLLHCLAEHVSVEPCVDSESGYDCEDQSLCVTEYCPSCAARWWIQSRIAKRLADNPEILDEIRERIESDEVGE